MLARTRGLIRDGYARLSSWIADSDVLLSIVPPEATALAFVRYQWDASSIEVCTCRHVVCIGLSHAYSPEVLSWLQAIAL